MRPTLRPALFEDVSGQVAAVQLQLKELADNLSPLKGLTTDAAKSSDAVKLLVEQATVHYQRGQVLGTGEQLLAARQCFNDALALLKGVNADRRLEGRVLLALAGVEKMLGNLLEAEAIARRSIQVLVNEDATALAQARGALALEHRPV
jgi:tetratricopeptide (TPR) repeat protein